MYIATYHNPLLNIIGIQHNLDCHTKAKITDDPQEINFHMYIEGIIFLKFN